MLVICKFMLGYLSRVVRNWTDNAIDYALFYYFIHIRIVLLELFINNRFVVLQ